MRPFTVAVEFCGVTPRPSSVVFWIDFVPGKLALCAHNLERRLGILEGSLVFGQLLAKWIVRATNAGGGGSRIHVVCWKSEYPHDAGGCNGSKDFIEARIVLRVG